MTKQIRLLTVTLTIEVDADQVDTLPDVDGFVNVLGDGQVPISGLKDLSLRLSESCIRGAFKLLDGMHIDARLDDATTAIGDRREALRLDQWFY